jgi:hypothetical protein
LHIITGRFQIPYLENTFKKGLSSMKYLDVAPDALRMKPDWT